MKGAKVKKKLLVLMAAGLLLVGAACGGSDDGGSESEGTSTEAEGESSGGGSVSLTAANFEFEPGDLSAAAGDTIEFTNEDDAPHTFTAEDAGIDEEVDAGGSTSISLADAEPGSYDFVCTIHPEMKGTLEITE